MKRILLITTFVICAVFCYSQQNDPFQDAINKSDFNLLEKLAKTQIEKNDNDFLAYVYLNLALNSSAKYDEAESIRNKLLAIWNDTIKADFIRAGKPDSKATWLSIIKESKYYKVLGAEYLMPSEIGMGSFIITQYYKIIVYRKKDNKFMALYTYGYSDYIEAAYSLNLAIGDMVLPPVSYGKIKLKLTNVVDDLINSLDKNYPVN